MHLSLNKLLIIIFLQLIVNTGQADIKSLVGDISKMLSEFTSSQEECDRKKLDYNFKPECSSYLLENIKTDQEAGSRFSRLTKIDSPSNICDNIDINFRRINTLNDVEVVLSRSNKTSVQGAKRVSSLSCFDEIDKIIKDPSGRLKAKKNLIAEYNISLKRLEHASNNYVSEVATINSLLGDSANLKSSCSKVSVFSSVRKNCKRLSRCGAKGGLNKLTDQTKRAIADLKSLDSLIENAKSRKNRQDIKSNPSFIATKKIIYANNPWLEGKAYRKSITSGSSIEKSIARQFKANRKKIRQKLKKNNQAVNCLNGKSKDCKDIGKIISSAPEIKKYNVDVSKLRNASTLNKHRAVKKMATDHYISKMQCLSEVRNLKKEQSDSITDLGVNVGLTVATGGLGAMAGGAKFASLATRASALGSSAPKLTAFAKYIKTPLGAARASVWSADGAFAVNELSQGAHACDKKLNNLKKVGKVNKAKYCPGNLSRPAYSLQADYKSCFIEMGLASLGILPFAPDIVAGLIRGRKIRGVLVGGEFSNKQIKLIANLQDNVPEKQLELLLKEMKTLDKEEVDLVFNELIGFRKSGGEFADYISKVMSKLGVEDKIPLEKASKVILAFGVDPSSYIQIAEFKNKAANYIPEKKSTPADNGVNKSIEKSKSRSRGVKRNFSPPSVEVVQQNRGLNKQLGFMDDGGELIPGFLSHKHIEATMSSGKPVSGVVVGEKVIGGEKFLYLNRGGGNVELVSAKDISTVKVFQIKKSEKPVSSGKFLSLTGELKLENVVDKIVSVVGKDGEYVTGVVERYTNSASGQLLKINDNGKIIELKGKNISQIEVFNQVKEPITLAQKRADHVKEISLQNTLVMPSPLNKTVKQVDPVKEAVNIFKDSPGQSYSSDVMSQNDRMLRAKNGEAFNASITNVASHKSSDIIKIKDKITKPIKRGYYTYAILDDGSLVMGKVKDTLEYGVKHLNIADGKSVKVAGELKVRADGKYIFNTESGSFTKPIAYEIGENGNEILEVKAEQALESFLGQGEISRNGTFFDELPAARLEDYCIKGQPFYVYNFHLCCKKIGVCN